MFITIRSQFKNEFINLTLKNSALPSGPRIPIVPSPLTGEACQLKAGFPTFGRDRVRVNRIGVIRMLIPLPLTPPPGEGKSDIL